MKILYHITGAITFVNEMPWVVEPIYLAQVCSWFPALHELFQFSFIFYLFLLPDISLPFNGPEC